jgi:hypothetical protein
LHIVVKTLSLESNQKQTTNKMETKNFEYIVIWHTHNKFRKDSFLYNSYSKAVVRMQTLKSIFKSKNWNWNIIIKEQPKTKQLKK